MTESPQPLFREEVLDNLSSPDQVDRLLVVTKPSQWMVVLAVLSVMAALLFWGLFGSLPLVVEGRSVALSPNGVFVIEARTQGVVQEYTLREGSQIFQDQPIVLISNFEDDVQEKGLATEVAALEENVSALRKQITEERDSLREAINDKLKEARFSLVQLEGELKTLEQNLTTKISLLKSMLIARDDMVNAESRVIAKKIEVEQTRARISGFEAELIAEHRSEEYKQREQELREKREALQLIRMRQQNAQVKAPESGRVLELMARKGQHVEPGAPLFWMERGLTQGPPVFYGYLPVSLAKKVKVGNEVQVEFGYINRQEQGALLGRVTEISAYAVSEEGLATTLQNETLAKYLIADGTVIQVVVEGLPDPGTPSGFRWTSGTGPDDRVTPGAVGVMKIVVERVRPLYYLLPIWWFRYVEDRYLP